MTTFKDLQHGTVNPFQSNTKAISYSLDKTLEQGVHKIDLITNGTYTLGLWLDDKYVGMFCGNSLTFELANNVYVEDVIIKEYDESGSITSAFIGIRHTAPVGTYPAQSYESFSLLNPISKVTMYWDDVSAFESGDDSGSQLVIDNPWATQAVTDYVYSVLNGYEYIPVKGTKVRADPAIQLGDVFTYGDTNQLVASVNWIFGGSPVADVESPMNNEQAFDDPYDTLWKNQFKRKLTLGDSYQGVTIGRENGIENLMSPDGTVENAIGRYYSDLTKGMAFQTRNSPEDEWFDWMYLDIPEKTFKLSLYNTSTEVDAKIDLSVEQMQNYSIAINLNGEMGNYQNWTFDSTSTLPIYLSNLTFGDIATFGGEFEYNFEILNNPNGRSVNLLSFWKNGSATNGKWFTLQKQFSFKYKRVSGSQTFNLLIHQYDEDDSFISTISESFNSSKLEHTFDLEEATNFVSLEFSVTGVTFANRLELADMMFNAGLPKEYVETPEDIRAWTLAQIELVGDTINLNAQAIDSVYGDIHNAGVEINAIDGVTTYGSSFKVMDSNRERTLMEVVTENGVDITRIFGRLESGSVGDWTVVDGLISSKNNIIELDSINEQIRFGSLELSFATTQNYDYLWMKGSRYNYNAGLGVHNDSPEGHSIITVNGLNGQRVISADTGDYNAGVYMLGIGNRTEGSGIYMTRMPTYNSTRTYAVADVLDVTHVRIGTTDRLLEQSIFPTNQGIPNGSNIDFINDSGAYHITSNTNAGTMSNLPVSSAGILTVYNSNFIQQTYLTYNNSAYYVRVYYPFNQTWSTWKNIM